MTRTEIDDTEKNLRSDHFLVFDSEECCRGSASLELSEQASVRIRYDS